LRKENDPRTVDRQDDQRLNAAITAASIKDSFESYLDIVEQFDLPAFGLALHF